MATTTQRADMLQASRVEPRVLDANLGPVISTIAPLYHSALRLQAVVSAITVQAVLATYFAACLALEIVRIIAAQALWTAKLGAAVSGRALRWAWSSKGVVRMREAVFLSFARFILGSGNGLILVVFWPGWWVLGGTTWVVLWVCG